MHSSDQPAAGPSTSTAYDKTTKSSNMTKTTTLTTTSTVPPSKSNASIDTLDSIDLLPLETPNGRCRTGGGLLFDPDEINRYDYWTETTRTERNFVEMSSDIVETSGHTRHTRYTRSDSLELDDISSLRVPGALQPFSR